MLTSSKSRPVAPPSMLVVGHMINKARTCDVCVLLRGDDNWLDVVRAYWLRILVSVLDIFNPPMHVSLISIVLMGIFAAFAASFGGGC